MNFEHIFYNYYKVANQNGLNNALYHFYEGHGFDKQEIREMVESFPTSYPCEIYIVDQTFECRRIFIQSPDGNVRHR